jgi:hypothetical protein
VLVDALLSREGLDEAGRLRRQTRGDRRATSAPLLAFGAITVVDALLRAVVSPVGDVALLLLAPAGFALVAAYYRHRQTVTGVGGRARPYAMAALVTLVVLPFALFLGLYAVVGLALLVIAVRQRNLYLGVWAVLYGVLGFLESLYLISNRIYAATAALGLERSTGGYFSWAPSIVYGLLGASLIGAGLYAHRREVAPA